MAMPAQRDLSPPATKRRRVDKLSSPSSSSPTTGPPRAATVSSRPISDLKPNQIRVFTWNVNGITPFLQKPITSFFAVSPRKKNTSVQPKEETETEAKTEMDTKARNNEGSSNEGEPRSTSTTISHNLRQCLRRWKWPQVLCLQEVKIAPGDIKTQAAVRRAVATAPGSTEPSYLAFFSLPRDKYNARGFGGKIYGVCCIVREDLLALGNQNSSGRKAGAEPEAETMATTVEPVDWDREGRVLALKLSERRLLMLNVYAVNGTDNPYRDPHTGIEVGVRHDHKRHFHTHLRNMVAQYEADGWGVVVAGDINIARNRIDGFPGIRLAPAHVQNRADFEVKFMRKSSEGGLGMIDSFRELHGNEAKFTYRSPGIPWGVSCDRVDLILLTKNMTENSRTLIEADILDEERERGPSDHLPSYITIKLSR